MHQLTTAPSLRRQIEAGALFFAILIVSMGVLAKISDHAARGDRRQKASWTFMHTGGSYDFLVLGSSRAYTTTDVHTLEDSLHATGLNIAEDGASYRESEMVFDRFMKTNSACTLLLEVDWFGLDTTGKNANVWKYVPFLGDSLVDAYVRRSEPQKFYMWKWIPFSKYAEFNERIGWRSVLHELRHAPSPFDDRGSYLLEGDYAEPEANRHQDVRVAVDSPLVGSLLRTIAAAQSRRMRVVLYMAPDYRPMRSLWLNRTEMIDLYKEMARTSGVDLLLFDDLPLAGDSANFRDAEHVNRIGALRFSVALAHELRLRDIRPACRQNSPLGPSGATK